ncbi:MAG: DNA polymerase IV [Rhodocyclaceae bacterium]|nr:DNA polymerase IV [Rhodocyclaceae bacterium]
MRWIAHLDMDAFYASIELLRYPELCGQPMVVGGRHQPVTTPDGERQFARLKDYAGRGVITTATYEARALGVHSGMGLMKAAVLAPEAILLPVDFDEYRRMSRLFKAAVRSLTPVVEDRGIDEIYIDLTDVPGAQERSSNDPHAGVRRLGSALKDSVRAATGLNCSLGITPNKLLSKLCSDLEKPDGLTILTPDELQTRIWPLPAQRINGIGPKASAKLEALGIHTIGELAAMAPLELITHFGALYGRWLHEAAHGRDERPLLLHSEPKSLSRETTFERDLHPLRDRAALGPTFTALCERLAEDLQRKGYVAKTIGIKLRFDDFKIVTRDQTLLRPTDDALEIRRGAGLCLKRVPLERRLRLLGVRAGGLCKTGEKNQAASGGQSKDGATLPLFE